MTKKKLFSYPFPRPAVAVDCVVFGFDAGVRELEVALIRRNTEPFVGEWALPGGFVREGEDLDAAARRELAEETGIAGESVFLEQLYTFGHPDRHPGDRVISVAYFALVRPEDYQIRADTDVSAAEWYPISKALKMKLAFDHSEILKTALERLRGKLRYQPIGFNLLPKQFTLTQLQQLYETVLARPLDKRNFRKKILMMDLLVDTGKKEVGVRHRAAKLYRFNRQKYRSLQRRGFMFEI